LKVLLQLADFIEVPARLEEPLKVLLQLADFIEVPARLEGPLKVLLNLQFLLALATSLIIRPIIFKPFPRSILFFQPSHQSVIIAKTQKRYEETNEKKSHYDKRKKIRNFAKKEARK
jgi:hypothetical protein